MFTRVLTTTFFFVALGLGTSACTNKEPVVDTGLTPPTDPTTTTPYNGANIRDVDRGWRLVHDTAVFDWQDPKLRDPMVETEPNFRNR